VDLSSATDLNTGLVIGAGTLGEPTRPESARINRERGRNSVRAAIHYHPVDLQRAWHAGNTKAKGLETITYRFAFSNGLSSVGIWLKSMSVPDSPSTTIILDDRGRKGAATVVSDRVNRGDQVLAGFNNLGGDGFQ
jgi:hypothetical protein